MPRISVFSISTRASTRAPRSVVSEVSEMSDHGVGRSASNRLQWWRNRHEQRQNGHRDSIASGPKSPDTPHSHFDPVHREPELPPLSANARPGSMHYEYYASDPPPFTSRPGTRAGPPPATAEPAPGVRFAQPGSDDGANHDVERGPRLGHGLGRRFSMRAAPGAKPKWYQKESWVGIRRQLISLFFSGLVLSVILAVYLGLTLSNALPRDQTAFQVLLILVLLVTGMFFCHSLVRLCIVITQPHRSSRHDSLPFDFLGSTHPTHPIRIRTDPADTPTSSPKVPPPAYGLWRYSVRVDPSQIYWVRNENGEMVDSRLEERPTTSGEPRPRPPSYASDDGVTYVIEAGQPHQQERLPPHPSEAGRL